MASSAPSSRSFPVLRLQGKTLSHGPDSVVVEDPLEMVLNYQRGASNVTRSAGITFRTPGHDRELVTGFLFNEGLLPTPDLARRARISFSTGPSGDVASVTFPKGFQPDVRLARRAFARSSSCGACGKVALDQLKTSADCLAADNLRISVDFIHSLPALLNGAQPVFRSTGGLHAAALINARTGAHTTREDIGRHNAVDKVIGHALLEGLVPARDHVLFVSSRAGFEIVQKALAAGIQIIATVGAPSTLALKLAADSGATLLGFVREERCNIYSGFQRIEGASATLSRAAS